MEKMNCYENSTSFTKISIKNSKGTNDLAYFSAASMTTKKKIVLEGKDPKNAPHGPLYASKRCEPSLNDFSNSYV